jgi:Fe2+ transport system protein FeoA
MMLSHLALEQPARVAGIDGGHGVQRNLNQLGIHVGDIIALSRRGAFHGPLLVDIHGMQVALGRGVAHHIHVEPLTNAVQRRRHHARHGHH